MVLVIWLLCGLIGFFVGEKKNRPILGLSLGFLLGIFGVIIIAVIAPKDETKN
jgi:membrane associated rhomboid family serine protease